MMVDRWVDTYTGCIERDDNFECSHCGTVVTDSFEFEDEEQDYKCQECEKTFKMWKYIKVTYITCKEE